MDTKIKEINASLKNENVKARLKLINNGKKIGLQATFPVKPGHEHYGTKKQYTICSFDNNDSGIKEAVAVARILNIKLSNGTFHWNDELVTATRKRSTAAGAIDKTQKNYLKPISECISLYKEHFFKNHKKDKRGLTTWKCHYQRHLSKLPQSQVLSLDKLKTTLEKTEPGTNSRYFMVWCFKKFLKWLGAPEDYIKLVDSYRTTINCSKERYIPTDQEIEEFYELLVGTGYEWYYGMMATYGLRPHELFAVDIDRFLDPKNDMHIVYINDDTKTGARLVPPLHPKWVDLFKLKELVKIRANNHEYILRKLRDLFRNFDLPYSLYALRHAYAIRGHALQIPIKSMSDFMGHSLDVHSNTYQRWMDKKIHLDIYKKLVLK